MERAIDWALQMIQYVVHKEKVIAEIKQKKQSWIFFEKLKSLWLQTCAWNGAQQKKKVITTAAENIKGKTFHIIMIEIIPRRRNKREKFPYTREVIKSIWWKLKVFVGKRSKKREHRSVSHKKMVKLWRAFYGNVLIIKYFEILIMLRAMCMRYARSCVLNEYLSDNFMWRVAYFLQWFLSWFFNEEKLFIFMLINFNLIILGNGEDISIE